MTVEERLARLETAEEVRRVVAAYAAACDHYDVEAVGAIVHPDVVLTAGGHSWNGRDQVMAFFRDRWASVRSAQRHFVTNVSFGRLEADGAEATSYFLHVTAAGDRSLVGWGSYRDTFTRHDGAVVFRAKEIAMDVQVGLDEGWAAALTGVPR